MYDVPPIGVALPLRGVRVTVTLDEFAPTHVDAWYGHAVVGDRAYPAIVVRLAGDVVHRGLLRRGAVPPDAPSPDAVLGVVVERDGATVRWLPPGDRVTYARNLSTR
jgi:hypothetical protein